VDVQLPKLADTLVEGTVSRWLKRTGETVYKGEPLVEIETDKVNSELEAPADGILTEILVPAGETVEVGKVIARISDGGAAGAVGSETSAPSLPSPPSGEESSSKGLSPMRRRIAERMQEARATIPQGSCVREADLSRIQRDGQSWTAFFVKALAAGAGVANVGVAVEVEGGLVVPVVKGADALNVAEISERLRDLASRARDRKLKPEDMTEGAFTITNVGMTGTLMAFPLLNPGQPGILAPGAIRDGRCYVTLCYDRRAMDDYAADRLLARVTEELEKL
jgi:pyruvate/2-oxoglutarate dehydrogenase complex dihydrolipoamide acyltransferase (E2) component